MSYLALGASSLLPWPCHWACVGEECQDTANIDKPSRPLWHPHAPDVWLDTLNPPFSNKPTACCLGSSVGDSDTLLCNFGLARGPPASDRRDESLRQLQTYSQATDGVGQPHYIYMGAALTWRRRTNAVGKRWRGQKTTSHINKWCETCWGITCTIRALCKNRLKNRLALLHFL